MKKKNQNELINFDDYIDKKYGKSGAPKREKWEAGFEAFKIGVILEEARLKTGMTQ